MLCRSDDGLANQPKLVTSKTCNCVVQDCVLNK